MWKQLNYIFSRSDKVKVCILLVAVILGSFMELLGISLFSPFVEVITTPSIIEQ